MLRKCRDDGILVMVASARPFKAIRSYNYQINDDEIDHYSWLSVKEAKTALLEWYLPVIEKISEKFEVKQK